MYRIAFYGPGGNLRYADVPETAYLDNAEALAVSHKEAWVWGTPDPDGCRPYIGRAVYDFLSDKAVWYPVPPGSNIFWREE